MELLDVAVTPLPPERFSEMLGPDALAAFARTISHGFAPVVAAAVVTTRPVP